MYKYTVSYDSILLAFLFLFDSIRVRIFGLPKYKNGTPKKIAGNLIRKNYKAGKVIYAGAGHLKAMWIMDFTISLRGLETVLTKKEIKSVIAYMLDESSKLGRVPSSFSQHSGFDAPFLRGDNFPALLYCIWEYTRWSNDHSLFENNKEKIIDLLNQYESISFGKNGLISNSILFDWVDTIARPSSTWNNLWALKTMTIAQQMQLKTINSPKNIEKAIYKKKLKKDYLIDHVQTENLSIDAALLAVYLDLLDRDTQIKLLRKLRQSGYLTPFPMKASAYRHKDKFIPLFTKITANLYHETVIWPFLGFMYLNGCKKLNLDYISDLKKMESMVMYYRNFLETLDPGGEKIYLNLLSCDHGFTMAASQYLELISDS